MAWTWIKSVFIAQHVYGRKQRNRLTFVIKKFKKIYKLQIGKFMFQYHEGKLPAIFSFEVSF